MSDTTSGQNKTQTHRDQREDYQKGGGRGMGQKEKENIVNNILLSLCGDR